MNVNNIQSEGEKGTYLKTNYLDRFSLLVCMQFIRFQLSLFWFALLGESVNSPQTYVVSFWIPLRTRLLQTVFPLCNFTMVAWQLQTLQHQCHKLKGQWACISPLSSGSAGFSSQALEAWGANSHPCQSHNVFLVVKHFQTPCSPHAASSITGFCHTKLVAAIGPLCCWQHYLYLESGQFTPMSECLHICTHWLQVF